MTDVHKFEVNDLSVLSGRLLFAMQDEMYTRIQQDGYPDLVPRHDAVLAHLRPDGVRATELAQMCGQIKQVVGQIIDDLERLGYVRRKPDPADRRAKLVVPTASGRRLMAARDAVVNDITNRHARQLGEDEFSRFLDSFRTVVDQQQAAVDCD